MDPTDSSTSLLAATLLTPAILFFVLGLGAGFARSDLTIPEQVAKTLSLYLMLAIGFKGGVEAHQHGLDGGFLKAAGIGFVSSLLVPFLAYGLLRLMSRLDVPTAAATAAHYGSVSVVTFAAGGSFLNVLGVPFGGYMAAVLAIMETPAILSALLIAGSVSGPARIRTMQADFLREVFLNAAAVMLIGSFVIGLLTGPAGMAKLDVFVGPLFQGALCIFLLEMGLAASRRLSSAPSLRVGLIVFAILMPLLSASLVLLAAWIAGLSVGDAAMLTILAGSASYIAVPAAMRVALPQADPGVYLSLSLGVTFPFNLLLGIPLYTAAARWLIG